MLTCSIYMNKCSTGKLWQNSIPMCVDINMVSKVVDFNTRQGHTRQNTSIIRYGKWKAVHCPNCLIARQYISVYEPCCKVVLIESNTQSSGISSAEHPHSNQVPWMSNKRANSTRQCTINPVVLLSLDQTCWTVCLCHTAHWG